MTQKVSRRQFMIRSAGAAGGAVALPVLGQNIVTDAAATKLKWSKAPCRFCGVGCGVNVAVKDGQVVATHGDPQSEVNRGVNCVKGYFLSKIMYGEDRLTRPLLRMKNGRYDKSGRVHAGQLGPGLRHHGGEVEGGAEEEGPLVGRHVHVRPVDHLGGLRRGQADEGRLPLQQHRPQRAPLHGERRGRASCAPSASTSRWAATTTSSTPTRSCCGARTWRRCTRSCGAARRRPAPRRTRTCRWRCSPPSSTAATSSPTCRSPSGRRPTSRS